MVLLYEYQARLSRFRIANLMKRNPSIGLTVFVLLRSESIIGQELCSQFVGINAKPIGGCVQ